MAELRALQQGLQLLWEGGFEKIICESDSLDVVNMLKAEVSHLHPYSCIMVYIKKLLSLEWDVQITYTLREGNACADYLAKLGANGSDALRIWNAPPSDEQLVSGSRILWVFVSPIILFLFPIAPKKIVLIYLLDLIMNQHNAQNFVHTSNKL